MNNKKQSYKTGYKNNPKRNGEIARVKVYLA